MKSLAVGTAGLALGPVTAFSKTSGRKMNVLFIAVDDLRPQLGCYGNKLVKSPVIDKLASESLLFEHAYCQQAVCAPSRISVMTGCRPDTTTVYDLNTPLRKAMPDVLSLCEHFKNNVYETLSIGKIYHHRDDDKQGWSVSPFRATGKWQGRGYMAQDSIIQSKEYAKMVKESKGRGPAYESPDIKDN